jgi:hypothetical protein
MTLRVAVLTTDTSHHRWFVQQLVARSSSNVTVALVLFETRAYPWERNASRHRRANRLHPVRRWFLNPYNPSPRLDRAAAEWEEPRFFPAGNRSLSSSVRCEVVRSVNDLSAIAFIDEAAIDVIFVYGTGLVTPEVFTRTRLGAVNAHGGLLPDYRGLDTNLWAALQGHPEDMAVTLHQVDASLDTGDVLSVERLGPRQDLCLASLRYETTVLCADMAVDLFEGLAADVLVRSPQMPGGEYFGPMPSLLKRCADRNIRRWVTTSNAS